METVKQELLDWLRESIRNDEPINSETLLLVDGMLDSLHLVQFITFAEDLIGFSLPDEQFKLEYFSSVNAICRAYFNSDSME